MFPKNLLSFLLLALGAAHASPVGRDTGKAALIFSTKINTAGFSNLVEKDRARAQALKNLLHPSERNTSKRSVSATNAAVIYTAEVGVGTPPTNYTLLIDTGSSNTWVGASKPYVPTTSSVPTGDLVFIEYGSGIFSGTGWTDTVTLASDLVIQAQSMGVAGLTEGIDPYDGILGLGPTGLTKNTIVDAPEDEIPTVTDNLYTQRTIPQEVLGVLFSPASSPNSNGELTFGGHDDSVITSPLKYVPLTTTSPASRYWGIDQSIFYGTTTILTSTAGIVDTGTSLLLIATDAFQKYQSATGSTMDSTTGLLTITLAQYAKLETLSFNIGGTSYELSPNAQIWPRSLNSAIGGISGAIYLVVADIGSPSGDGLDFINGYTFLERFYSVFDTTNKRVGFAPTAYTNATTN